MSNRKNFSRPKFWIVLAVILVIGAVRVFLADVPNIAPVAAMALFGGAYFFNKRMAFLIPLAVMFLSDLALEVLYLTGLRQFAGFHAAMPYVYAGFALMVFIGTFLKNKTRPLPVFGAGLLSSVLFFVISNFGVWASGTIYPLNLGGLVECYTMAIPYFRYTLLGDMLFVAVFFGGFELLKAWRPSSVLASA